jgi:hypothetical protein
MLAQNKDSSLTLPQLFLACPLRQRYFNFPSQGKKECTSIHFFIPKYSPELKLSYSDLLRNLMTSVRFFRTVNRYLAQVGCINKASCTIETTLTVKIGREILWVRLLSGKRLLWLMEWRWETEYKWQIHNQLRWLLRNKGLMVRYGWRLTHPTFITFTYSNEESDRLC